MKKIFVGNLIKGVNISFICLFCASIFSSSSLYQTDEYNYIQRKNRMEGLRSIPSSGADITLLSFINYREALSLSTSSSLKIRFFNPSDGQVFITAVELRRHGQSHYQMKPTQTSWSNGWQEFSAWPVGEVLRPLNIPPDHLGIVARINSDRIGSGIIAPVMFFENTYPKVSSKYKVHLIPKNTLTKVEYYVVSISDKSIVISKKEKKNLAANVPFEVVIDLENLQSGNYQLVIKTKVLGRTTGSSRQYTFFHNS